MLVIDRMLIGGVRFVLDKLARAVDGELNDDTRLREELLAAQMKVELGEMTPEEFAALEDEILLRIREIRRARGELVDAIEWRGGKDGQTDAALAGIDADFVADDYYGEPESPPSAAVVDAVATAPAPPRRPVKGRPRRPAAKKAQKKRAPRRRTK